MDADTVMNTQRDLKKLLTGNSKGFAVLESVPLLLVLMMLLGATLGSWGLVHTAILNSIAARHNAFFILNHRPDLHYRRDFGPHEYPGLSPLTADMRYYYGNNQSRFFFVKSEKNSSGRNRTATTRFVNFLNPQSKKEYYPEEQGFLKSAQQHNLLVTQESQMPARKIATQRVDPAWIMVGYGICLNSTCGE